MNGHNNDERDDDAITMVDLRSERGAERGEDIMVTMSQEQHTALVKRYDSLALGGICTVSLLAGMTIGLFVGSIFQGKRVLGIDTRLEQAERTLDSLTTNPSVRLYEYVGPEAKSTKSASSFSSAGRINDDELEKIMEGAKATGQTVYFGLTDSADEDS